MELGNRSVSSLELEGLAHLFGRDMREFLRGDFRTEDPLVALFRAQPEVAGQEPVMDPLRECLVLGRDVTNLEHLLQIDRASAIASYPLAGPKSKWDAIQQGNRIADEERRRLGLGSTPVGDLVEMLEFQGLRTAVVRLPEDVSGLTINDLAVGVLVVANKEHHYLRRRFSLAHEYGHVLLDRERLSTVSRTTDQDQLIEVRANAFAATFLMPEDGVREFLAGLGKGHVSRGQVEILHDDGSAATVEGRLAAGSQDLQLYDLVQLAHHFGVSRMSALYRLKNLRIASRADFDRLKALEDAGRGAELTKLLNLAEPDHEAERNEFVHRVVGLALEAFRREAISRAKLYAIAEHVEISPDAVDSLLVGAGLSQDPDN
jgi:Zn-dependent peptidase ImmA (M78 family)